MPTRRRHPGPNIQYPIPNFNPLNPDTTSSLLRFFTVGIAVAAITVLSGIMYLVEHKSLMTKAER